MAKAAERRALRMHPRLLWDVIHRQAGSLAKSVLEGTQNCIDSGSTKCDIKLDQRRLSIEDDGKGFVDRREIEDFFETFGYPHEEGDARFGRFRMGRGQLFAAGRNRWTSNQFVMDVDLKPQANQPNNDFELGYLLREVPPAKARPGCLIEVTLYDPMNNWILESTCRSIAEHVAWAEIPVTLNGNLISRNPATAEWDMETPDAWISLRRTGNLTVYNMGVLVCALPASKLGTGGIIVTKSRLDVNFARNAVQGTCEVWKRISKAVTQQVNKDIVKPQRLDDAGREMLARGIMDGAGSLLPMLKQRLITDVTGSHRTLASLMPTSYSRSPVAVAPTGDRVGDIVMQRKMALVLSQDTLDRFAVPTVEALLQGLIRAAQQDMEARGVDETWRSGGRDPVEQFLNGIRRLQPTPMEGFRAAIKDSHMPVDPKDLTKGEKMALDAIQTAAYTVHQIAAEWCRNADLPVPAYREVRAGTSDTANGWTDGVAHTWINRRLLPRARTAEGRLMLAGLLLHEYLHREPDTDTHVHDVAFYQQFHDIVQRTEVLHRGSERIRSLLDGKIQRAERMAKPDDVPLEDDLAAPGPEPDPEERVAELVG